MQPLDPATPPPDGPARRRTRYLAVLVDERDIALLQAARGCWSDHGTLEFAVEYSGKALSKRFTRLTEIDLLAKRKARGQKRHNVYEYILTPGGEALLDHVHTQMVAAAVALDATAGKRRELLRAAARDRCCLVVARVVLYKPQSFTEVLEEARALGRVWGMAEAANLDNAGLTRRLDRLQELGLVVRERSRDRAIAYARGPQMWLLARLAVEASLWRCVHTPERIPPLAGELLGLVEMLLDRLHLDPDLGPATIVLHMQPPAGMPGWLDAALEVDAGRIHVIRSGAPHHPDAYVQASPRTWDEALRSGDPDALTIDGDPKLAHAVHAAIAAALPS